MDGRWVPPIFPWYKVNVDAAVFSHLGMTGISVIIRDHFGLVIDALSKRLPLPLAPLEAEAKALDEATVFAWDIGVRDVIFETDSTTVYRAMESPIDAPVYISTIVLGLCSRLHEFRTFQASHVGRQGNKSTHTLAAFAKNIDSFVTWMAECPPFFASFGS